ncbi:hypothetical protein [Natronorubrum sp. DTA7]|uniref:hypothetical protein n=1 Tax=Natronorubrum sp. DTA7 TaxID=3447016 RepID=UPI003F86E4E7
MSEANSKQGALPGLEPGEPEQWIITAIDAGLEYHILVEAMSRTEARETFESEFEMYELGVEDDEFDWDHETVFARSQDNAEAIVLERDRDYMRVYDWSCLGNTADIESVDRADDVDGWKKRRATSDAEVVDR